VRKKFGQQPGRVEVFPARGLHFPLIHQVDLQRNLCDAIYKQTLRYRWTIADLRDKFSANSL
jgi:hypothetical protein